MDTKKGVILLILFSCLTGLTAYFVKLTVDITAFQILFFRAVIACLFLFTTAVFTKKLPELKLKFPIGTIIMGLTQGLSILFFFKALELTTVTNAVLLTYTAPIFSAVFAIIFLKERLEKNTIFAVFLSLAGILIIHNPNQVLSESDIFGSLYALLGGIFYGAMAISSKSVAGKTQPIYAAFWQYLIIMIFAGIFIGDLTVQTFTRNIIPLLYVGLLAGGFAFLIYMKGIKLVKGQKIQIITMLEVPIASLSGIILLGENLTLPIVLGGTLILAGVIAVSVKRKAVKLD